MKDNPIAFWPLDEYVATINPSAGIFYNDSATDYNDTTTTYVGDGGINTDYVFSDISGNGYHAIGKQISSHVSIPLVSGGKYGTQILSNTTIKLPVTNLASKYYTQAPFSMEIWSTLPDFNSLEVPVLYDYTNQIGFLFHDGDVIFKTQSGSVRYKVPSTRAHHIVGVYTGSTISLYIDGNLVKSNNLPSNFEFTNTSNNFIIGPCNGSNVFFVDSPAFYRYALDAKQILNHYLYGTYELNYSQIVTPDSGHLFSCNFSGIRPALKFHYPQIKSWTQIADNNVIVSADQTYITFEETSVASEKYFTFTEEIYIPNYQDIVSSQISWNDHVDNITVQVSQDNLNWQTCQNGYPIPMFKKENANKPFVMYLKVTMHSKDTTVDLPKLKNIEIDFFNNKDIYGDNNGYRIYSSNDYAISRYNYPILSQYEGNGIIPSVGFDLDMSEPIKTVEFFFTPSEINDLVLFSSNSKILAWDHNGNIEKNGIAGFYVNGVDRSSETNISQFINVGAMHHIIITMPSAATSNIKFNYLGSRYGSYNNLYNNIALYPSQFNSAKALEHYNMYIDRDIYTVLDDSVTLLELTSADTNSAYFVYSLDTFTVAST